MKPPIVINDSADADEPGDLRVYDSVVSAEKSLEYDDAFDGQLRVYEAEGLALRISADANRRQVHLQPTEQVPSHRDELLSILKDFHTRLGRPRTETDAMSLADLLRVTYARDPNPYTGKT